MKKILGPSAQGAAPGTIEVIASTGDVDRQQDRIRPRGIRFESYLRNPTVLWAHSYSTLPVGRTISLKATDQDLRAVIQFAPHDFAQQVYQSYRGEFLSGISIGFRPLSEPQRNDFGGLDFNETELLEISCVPIPANQEALVIARSMAGLDPGTDSTGRPWPWRSDDVIPDEVLAELVSSLPRSGERFCIAPAAEPGLWEVDTSALRSAIQEAIGPAMERQMARLTGRLD